eukprot:scaffold18389_cov99-Amphora_coffeaeformis.AAC.1
MELDTGALLTRTSERVLLLACTWVEMLVTRSTPGWPAAKDVTCFPFTNPKALEGRSMKMMGLQMMNDPSFGLSDGEVLQVEVNVEVYLDLFAVALKDIKKGEELFMSYQLEDQKRKAEDENNDGDRKKKARGESDEEGDGKGLSV